MRIHHEKKKLLLLLQINSKVCSAHNPCRSVCVRVCVCECVCEATNLGKAWPAVIRGWSVPHLWSHSKHIRMPPVGCHSFTNNKSGTGFCMWPANSGYVLELDEATAVLRSRSRPFWVGAGTSHS